MSAHRPAPIDHYENFPVASWLCPPRLRPPIAAIYHFARTADDIADEGSAPPAERLNDLATYRADLHAIARGATPSPHWAAVFQPLAAQMPAFQLPLQPLDDLLSAFAQDVRKTAAGDTYADWPELIDYCRRSANPVGRLLLHLYGVTDAQAQQESDAICTALQLINFWQDPTRDIPRRRYYFTAEDCARFGVQQADLLALRQTPETTNLIADCAQWAGATMLKGSKLVHAVPGRAGWELRLVVQGGLRILDHIEAQGYTTLQTRPVVGKRDVPVMLWRALRM